MTQRKFVLCSVMCLVFVSACSEEAGFTVQSQALDASKIKSKEQQVSPHKESDSHTTHEPTSAAIESGAEEYPEGSMAASSNEDPPSRIGGDEGPLGTSQGIGPTVDTLGNGLGNSGAPSVSASGGSTGAGHSQTGNGGSIPANGSANHGTSPGNNSESPQPGGNVAGNSPNPSIPSAGSSNNSPPPGNQGGGVLPAPEEDPGQIQDDLVDVGIAFIQEKSDAGYNNCLTIVLGGVEHNLGCSKEGKLDREMVIQARPFPECNNVRLIFKTYSKGKLLYTRTTQQEKYADNIRVTKAGSGATISFEDQPKGNKAYDGDFNDYVLTIKPSNTQELSFKIENSSALSCSTEQ